MVFKSEVQSIGNCLIRLDPKSCNLTFFKKFKKFDWGRVQRENGKKERRFSLLLFKYEKGRNF